MELQNSCWLWAKGCDQKDYGKIRNSGTHKMEPAHRFVYEALVGLIPNGLELDHLCRVTRCINPDHLEPVTGAENQRRARKTHCQNGHELAIHAAKDRHCKACKPLYDKQHYLDNAEKRKQQVRDYKKRNAAKVKAYSRAYYHSHKLILEGV